MPTNKVTIENLAGQLSKALEQKTRAAGHEPGLDHYTAVRDGSPQWMTDACRAAHGDGGMLPDDWRYEFIDDAASALAESEGDLDAARDSLNESDAYPYTAQQTGWLHSHNGRQGYVDEAARERGSPSDGVMAMIRAGMLAEQEETLQQLHAALEEIAEDMDGDDGEPVAEAVSA